MGWLVGGRERGEGEGGKKGREGKGGKGGDGRGDEPVRKERKEPLRAEHARLDALPQEMHMQHRQHLLDQSVKLQKKHHLRPI